MDTITYNNRRNRYQTLIGKADKCRMNAMFCETEGAKKLWLEIANKLELEAANLPLVHLI